MAKSNPVVMGGGEDRAWYSPLDQDGNRQSDRFDSMVGCHTGTTSGLNVPNPQPGWHYTWQDSRPQYQQLARMRGAIPVTSEDPEYDDCRDDSGLGPTALDTSDIYQDVQLFKEPIEAVRERREQEQAEARNQMYGGVERDFASNASAAELAYSKRGPSRFARSDHGAETRDQNEHVLNHWSPEDGIIPKG